MQLSLCQNSSVLIWSDLVSQCKYFNLWTYLTLMILLKANDNCICCRLKYLLCPLSVQSKQYWAIPLWGDWASELSCGIGRIDYKLGETKKKRHFGLDRFLNTTAVTQKKVMQTSKLAKLLRGWYYIDITRLSESHSNKLRSVKVDRTKDRIWLFFPPTHKYMKYLQTQITELEISQSSAAHLKCK